jgi:hypothetical protein
MYGIIHSESRASKRYNASNRVTYDVKWRELDFTRLLNSVLKCVPVLQIVAIRNV